MLVNFQQKYCDKIMRDSSESIQDDSRVGSNGDARKGPSPFKRSASEWNFDHIKQMERHYSKLGDGGANQKDKTKANGIIKVASLSSIHTTVGDPELDSDHFVGRRDVSNPNTIKEKRIVSQRGSIRGFKNRVRAGIATFIDQNGFSVCGQVLSTWLTLRF